MARLRHPDTGPEAPAGDFGAPDPAATDPAATDPAAEPGAPTGPLPTAPVAAATADSAAERRPSTRTRASTAYVGVAGSIVLLILVLVFIVQNLSDTSVHFFTANARLPVGVVILIAAVAGGLLVLLASAVRVLQLRRMARRRQPAA